MSIKEPARRFFEQLFNDADISCADEIAAPVYVEHAVAPFGRDAPGAVAGPAHLRETAAWLRAQFPDIRMTIESIVVEGDLVAVRVLSEGTNRAAQRRHPAHGTAVLGGPESLVPSGRWTPCGALGHPRGPASHDPTRCHFSPRATRAGCRDLTQFVA
jgi:hypothetical protein